MIGLFIILFAGLYNSFSYGMEQYRAPVSNEDIYNLAVLLLGEKNGFTANIADVSILRGTLLERQEHTIKREEYIRFHVPELDDVSRYLFDDISDIENQNVAREFIALVNRAYNQNSHNLTRTKSGYFKGHVVKKSIILITDNRLSIPYPDSKKTVRKRSRSFSELMQKAIKKIKNVDIFEKQSLSIAPAILTGINRLHKSPTTFR